MTTQLDQIEVLITLRHDEDSIARLKQDCPFGRFRIGPHVDRADYELDPGLMRGVEVLACEYPPANFDQFDKLKWIQVTSSGYTQVLGLPLVERGVRVTNGLGNFDNPIAEWNLMMMLLWRREMLEQLVNQRNAVFDPAAKYQQGLFGNTVGFWGYGGLARETARLAKALRMNVWAMTRDGNTRARPDTYCVQGTGDPQGVMPDRVFSSDQVEAFLGGLDFLVVAVPLTESTRGMIGENELRMLPAHAVLINPARAPIVQLEALTAALEQRWFRGASFDVHYAYPLPPDHPVWKLPNLILTPHIAGSSESPCFMQRFYDILGQNLHRFVESKPLLNELTAEQLSGA